MSDWWWSLKWQQQVLLAVGVPVFAFFLCCSLLIGNSPNEAHWVVESDGGLFGQPERWLQTDSYPRARLVAVTGAQNYGKPFTVVLENFRDPYQIDRPVFVAYP